MEIREFSNDYKVAFVGILETLKDEFSYLDDSSEEIFAEIYDEINETEYNNLLKEYQEKYKNLDEFKYFLLSLEDGEELEIIYTYVLDLTPIELDPKYSILDFLENNFPNLMGEPDPEINETDKIVFLYWLDYLNLLPEIAYEDETHEYMLNIWIEIDKKEFDVLYSKIPNKSALTVPEYENQLKEISSKITDQKIRDYIFDTIICVSDFDLEDDISRYPRIEWLENEWNIQYSE